MPNPTLEELKSLIEDLTTQIDDNQKAVDAQVGLGRGARDEHQMKILLDRADSLQLRLGAAERIVARAGETFTA